jgi:cytoskeletal protein CcmA (bactofilin family)
MFAKANKRPTTLPGGEALNAVPSIIGPEMVIQGNFKSGGELHVEGTIEGDINVRSLVVGKDAVLKGAIVADKVKVCGEVVGSIRAGDVMLAATARVIGDVHHDVLSIEPGAALDGLCKRREPVKSEAKSETKPMPLAKPNEPLRLTAKVAEGMSEPPRAATA